MWVFVGSFSSSENAAHSKTVTLLCTISVVFNFRYVLDWLFDLRAKTKQLCHKHDHIFLVRFTISGSVFLMQEGSLTTRDKNPHQ